MKIKKSQLRRIIREEKSRLLENHSLHELVIAQFGTDFILEAYDESTDEEFFEVRGNLLDPEALRNLAEKLEQLQLDGLPSPGARIELSID